MLGLLNVSDGGRPVSLPRGKERALLALLMVHANEPIASERVIEELWPQQAPQHAAKAVQIYVSRLRSHVGRERIQTTPAGYLFRAELEEIDVARFARLAEEGRERLESGEIEAAEALLTEALALWRGDALADFRFDAFAQGEIRRLEELRTVTIMDRAEARLALGRAEDVVGELEVLVREQPLRERPRRQLMVALYQTGRQADALSLYRATRTLLAEELGLDPSPELQSLERAILNQAPELERPVLARAAAARDRRGPIGGSFVGRHAELDELLAGFEDALAGRGRLFLLVGEPGIGKSRLADELARSARDRGASVLVGRCWEAGGAPAFWPWVQSLRGLVHDADAESLREELGPGAADLAQILPELRHRFPDLPAPPGSDSPAARFRLFDATAQFLRNASQRRPLVLILDDLHAADTPSLLLLQFLARELSASRILLLAACRDVDPTPGAALAGVFAEISREASTRRLALRGLSEAAVAEYVGLTAAEIGSPGLISTLYLETEGNPLFMTETVRLLTLERGRIPRSGAELVIPEGVRDVISRRLGHLTDSCNRILALASVLGREFAAPAVAVLADVSEGSLLETLDEAVSARVVSDVPGSPGRLRFAHVLIRDTLYEGIAATRRVRLHRQALAALEAVYDDELGPHLTELLHHAIAGDDVERGVLYAQRAGDRAVALLAYEEAARLYGLGLGVLASSPRARYAAESELLLGLGHAETRAGDAAAAKSTFLRASEIARRSGLPSAFARAALGYGGRFVWARAGDDELVVPLLREALELADESDTALRARLMARLAAALGDEPDGRERERLSRDAVEAARAAGDASTRAYALVARLAVIWSPAFADERLALATELVELATEIGDKERAVEGHGLRFNALMELGDVEAAAADLAARGRLTDEMRQPAQRWVQLVLETTRNTFLGNFEAAEKTLLESFELGGSRGEGAQAAFELQRFVLRRERGGLDEIASDLENCAVRNATRRALRCALANVCAALGRLDEARLHLGRLAADDFEAVPLDGDWLVSAAFLAETCRMVGDRDAAAFLYARLHPYAVRNVSGEGEVAIGAVSRYLGHLAAASGDAAEAVRHFEDALERNARMGARPWLAHTHHDLGELLLERGLKGDRPRAHDLLEAALATYRELGMQPHADRLATFTAP